MEKLSGYSSASRPGTSASFMPRRILGVCAGRRVRSRHDAQHGAYIIAGTVLAVFVDMPARSIDTATIAFGLVSIPIKIYSTSEPSHEVHFHLIHAGCGMRLHQ